MKYLRHLVINLSLVIFSSVCLANYSVSIIKYEPVALEEDGKLINTFTVEVVAQGDELEKIIYLRGHSETMDMWVELPLEYLYDTQDNKEVWGLVQPNTFGRKFDFDQIAVKYQTPDTVIWDNNAGKNYSVAAFNPFSLKSDQNIKLVKVEIIDKRERLRIHVVARTSLNPKAVGVQWTQNDWLSNKNISGVRNPAIRIDSADTEAWYIDLPLMNQSSTFAFKLYLDNSDKLTEWVWNDNNGKNYEVTTECRPEKCILNF